jgi:hypothetical protein
MNFYGGFPLCREEVQFNLKHGTERLCDRFAKIEPSPVLDVHRPNACKKRFWFF